MRALKSLYVSVNGSAAASLMRTSPVIRFWSRAQVSDVARPRERVLDGRVCLRAAASFEIDPDGSFLYWPELDVHLGWDQLLQAVEPAELHRAQQRSAGFNKQYGAAIRRVREAAGILQSRVEGLTDRQLRRIEQGECRTTTAAILALAKAHGLDRTSTWTG